MNGRARGSWIVSVLVGTAAAAGLVGMYLGLTGLAQGLGHAFDQLRADLPLVSAIAIGFGVQIALFAELRATHARRGGSGALTAASAGVGTAAMLACCAHHLVDVVPLVGLSAATVLLADYRTPLIAFSLAMNVVGVLVIGRQLIAARRCAIPTSVTAAGS